MRANTPVYTVVAVVALVAIVAVYLIFEHDSDHTAILLALVASTIPALMAAGFAEANGRNLKNGLVAEKARQGAAQALTDQEERNG